jgi:hypothetical protein
VTVRWRPNAVDLFHRFLDWRMRLGGVGNASLFVFELEGRLEPDELRERLDRLQALAPMVRGRLRGPPWRMEADDQPVPLVVDDGDGDAEAFFNRWYDAPAPRPREASLTAFLRTGETSLLGIRWSHVLMDATGCDLLCQLLDGADPERFKLVEERPTLGKRAARGAPAWRLVLAGLGSLVRYLATALPPPVQGKAVPGPAKVLFHSFDAQETKAVHARLRELGGADRNAVLLAIGARAFASVVQPAGWRRVCLPVPMNLRPPAWRGPVFANYLSTALVSVRASALETLPGAIEALRGATRRAIERHEDVFNLFMMAHAEVFPSLLMGLFIQGPTLRDPGSLYSSHVVLKAGRDGTFLGRPLRRALIGSQIPRPPGLAVAWVEAAGRLTAMVPTRGFVGAEDVLAHAVAELRGDGA